MIFRRRKKLYHNVKLLIDGQAIDEVQKTKFCGIIIDNKFTWKWNIDHIADKMSRASDLLYKKLDIMKLENINTYFIGRFIFCVSIDKFPQFFRILFRTKTINTTLTKTDLPIIYIYLLRN